MSEVEPGQCDSCVHGRRIRSGRGSIFWLCGRAATDPRYVRYPALPVLACPGFQSPSLRGGSMDAPPPERMTED